MIDASKLPGESGFHVQEDGRFTVIVKGFGGHPVRTWAEVSDEIIERILPALDLPEPTGRALLTRLHETNHLPPKKEDAMKNLDWDPCIVDPEKPAAPHLIPVEERERLQASWLANLRPHRPEDMLSDGDRSDVFDLMVAQPGVLHGRLRHHPRQTSDASREDI
ncbi:hypothetical protein ITJ57_18880 [Plantibacter sp. VKM Ac-2880]|uniref:hypothetical protein n=1 Tax=Plantibacter sp. VKM Ac-2880 TaxID=2783827 RepID=UPI00188E9DDF|nr:hypothetical protein [Plantibacter sp. VKM Ac-2880]MBF4570839.1 hypothetical protein [Plantibacter sp. VKM Ac-2880]